MLDLSERWPKVGQKAVFGPPGATEANLHLCQEHANTGLVEISEHLHPPIGQDHEIRSRETFHLSDIATLHALINRAEHFFRYLHWMPEVETLQSVVDVKFIGPHTVIDGRVRVVGETVSSRRARHKKDRYRINITSKHSEDLYITVFTFNSRTLTIGQRSQCDMLCDRAEAIASLEMHSQTNKQPWLYAGRSLPLQWRSNGVWRFFVPHHTAYDITYLKVFVSAEEFDFSFMEQSPEEGFTSAEHRIPPHLLWGVVTIPILVVSPDAALDLLDASSVTDIDAAHPSTPPISPAIPHIDASVSNSPTAPAVDMASVSTAASLAHRLRAPNMKHSTTL